MKKIKIIILSVGLLLVSVFLIMKNTTNNNNNDDIKDEDISISSPIREINLLGLAAFKSVENEQIQKSKIFNKFKLDNTENDVTNNNDLSKEKVMKVSYPYDYIKIIEAKEYRINIPKSNELDEIFEETGYGDLKIIIAEFQTYGYKNNTDRLSNDISKLVPMINDQLISIQGEAGIYTILLNSARYDNKNSKLIYSSHKKLTEDDVNKDLEPPFIGILVTLNEMGNSSISFTKSQNLAIYDDFNESHSYTFNSLEVNTLNREVMYSTFDLVKLPETTKIVKVIGINVNILEVVSSDNLYRVYIDEFTVSNTDLNTIKIDQEIEIKYDVLFDYYNPYKIYANWVKIIE